MTFVHIHLVRVKKSLDAHPVQIASVTFSKITASIQSERSCDGESISFLGWKFAYFLPAFGVEGILFRHDLLKFSLNFINLEGNSRDEIGGSGLRQYEIWRSCRASPRKFVLISSAVRCILKSMKPHVAN